MLTENVFLPLKKRGISGIIIIGKNKEERRYIYGKKEFSNADNP